MPISQSRMIALINAALDYKQAAQQMHNSIHHAFDAARVNPSNAFALLSDLITYADYEPSLKPDTLATLTVEYHHFRRNARANERAAQKTSSARRQAGAFPRSTTPRDIRLNNSASLPPAGILQHKQYQSSSTSYTAEDANREHEAYITSQIKADKICPHCHIANIDDCETLSECKWTTRILEQSKLESEQDGISF